MTELEDRKHPVSLEVVDIHLDYLRSDMRKVLAAIATMATKDDIRALEHRMQSFVTRSEFDALASKVQSGSVQSTFDRLLSFVTRMGAAAAVLVAVAGGIATLVHFLDKVPK